MNEQFTFSLTFDIEKGICKGVKVAQCRELPAIIIQGKNKAQIIRKAQDALTGYLMAFPTDKLPTT